MEFYKNEGIAEGRKHERYREVVQSCILHSCESWSWNKDMVDTLHGWESRNLDLMTSRRWAQTELRLEWFRADQIRKARRRFAEGGRENIEYLVLQRIWSYKEKMFDKKRNKMTDKMMRNTGLAASPGPLASPETRNGPPYGPPFWSEWAPLGGLGVRNFDTGATFRAPFLVWAPPFFGSKKTSKCEHAKKSDKSPSGSTNNACCFRHGFTKLCFLYKEKCTSQKCIFFRNFGSPHFCTVFSTICGTVVKQIMGPGVRN